MYYSHSFKFASFYLLDNFIRYQRRKQAYTIKLTLLKFVSFMHMYIYAGGCAWLCGRACVCCVQACGGQRVLLDLISGSAFFEVSK